MLCRHTHQSQPCLLSVYTAILFIVSVRSQSEEVQVSDSDSNSHWCGISMIPTTPTDTNGDASSEPGATVKSLIKSFDTVGQSEHQAPQHTPTGPPLTSV